MGIESKKECVYVYIYTYIHTKTLIKLTKKKIKERESSFELLFLFKIIYVHLRVFLVAQMVKNQPGMQETKDRGAWQGAVHGVTKSQTGLSD